MTHRLDTQREPSKLHVRTSYRMLQRGYEELPHPIWGDPLEAGGGGGGGGGEDWQTGGVQPDVANTIGEWVYFDAEPTVGQNGRWGPSVDGLVISAAPNSAHDQCQGIFNAMTTGWSMSFYKLDGTLYCDFLLSGDVDMNPDWHWPMPGTFEPPVPFVDADNTRVFVRDPDGVYRFASEFA